MAQTTIIVDKNTWIDGCGIVSQRIGIEAGTDLLQNVTATASSQPGGNGWTILRYVPGLLSTDRIDDVELRLWVEQIDFPPNPLELHTITQSNDFDMDAKWGERKAAVPWVTTDTTPGGATGDCDYEPGKFSPDLQPEGIMEQQLNQVSITGQGAYSWSQIELKNYIELRKQGIALFFLTAINQGGGGVSVAPKEYTYGGAGVDLSKAPRLVIDYTDTTAIPTPISPSGDQTLTSVTFTWSDTDADQYGIEIRNVTAGDTPFYSSNDVTSGVIVGGHLRGNIYRWRVRAFYAGAGFGWTNYSSWVTYDCDLLPPNQISPSSGQEVGVTFECEWDQDFAANEYDVQVDRDPGTGYESVKDETVVGSSNTTLLVESTIIGIDHRWRVKARSSETGDSAWSSYVYFNTNAGGAFIM